MEKKRLTFQTLHDVLNKKNFFQKKGGFTMSENAPTAELTPGQKRIAAAHAALAKKRAIAALEKLRAERIDIENKLSIEPPTPIHEEKQIPVEVPVHKEEKEIVQQQKEQTQPLNDEKELTKALVPMSSSEEIVIHELEKPKHDDTLKNKNKKKKKQKIQEDVASKPIQNERSLPQKNSSDKRDTSPTRKRPRFEKEESSEESEDFTVPKIRPKRKNRKVDNVKTVPDDNPGEDGTMGRIVNAVNGIRNITVPPVVSTVLSNSASTIGWGVTILAISYLRAYMASVSQSMEKRLPPETYYTAPRPQPTPPPQESQRNYHHTPQASNRSFIPTSSGIGNNPSRQNTTSYNIFR